MTSKNDEWLTVDAHNTQILNQIIPWKQHVLNLPNCAEWKCNRCYRMTTMPKNKENSVVRLFSFLHTALTFAIIDGFCRAQKTISDLRDNPQRHQDWNWCGTLCLDIHSLPPAEWCENTCLINLALAKNLWNRNANQFVTLGNLRCWQTQNNNFSMFFWWGTKTTWLVLLWKIADCENDGHAMAQHRPCIGQT